MGLAVTTAHGDRHGGIAPATPARDAGGTGGLAITHFNFQHRVFKTPGARFLLKGHQRVPTFRVDMGDMDGLIEIPILKKEFGIVPNGPDDQLIDLAVNGLRYVPDIKPGDTIPSELLTGKASWAVSPRHKKIAEQRLQVQLLSWVSGKEVLLTDPQEISMFLEQIENREKLRAAFGDAAKALGYEPGNTEPVVKQLELLARELCYIEALRDRFTLIPKIGEKMVELGKSYGSDRNAKMELNRVQALLQTGIQEYSDIFAEADAQTGEIVAALKSIERQVGYIRKIRDDLHCLIMQWDPHINDLGKWHTRRVPETDKALSNLYRFLAPRFSSGRSLLKSRADTKAKPSGPKQGKAAGQKLPSPDPKKRPQGP
jgi:hypothetical protein